MTQVAALLKELKACLKAQGKTYADVAQTLNLSEASIKRMFSEQDISLSRLEAVCVWLGIDISDLVRRMDSAHMHVEQLTHQQEYEITQDLHLVLVTVCVFNQWTLHEIITVFTLTEEECIRKLLKLDKLGLIQLMPGNRIKLLTSQRFRWIENGPFERFFREHIGQEYFDSHFQGERQRLIVLNGTLSRKTGLEFQRRMDRLAAEFITLSREDANMPMPEKEGVTLVLAMRNWDYGLFRHLIRT